jgi:signal transduction histidine kinase
MGDSAEDIARDVAAVGRIEAVPALLRVLCETTGMGFAAVARVSDTTWTACAVQDDIAFGLKPGGQLDLHTTLCTEVRASRTPVVIDKASDDPLYRHHHTPRIYGIESYVSVPIVLSNGDYFGNLCAIDWRPVQVSTPRIVSMFTLFAQLIALQLDNDRKRALAQAALLDEQQAGELREQFIAVLGHDLRNPLAAVAACGQLLQRKSTDPALVTIASRINTSVKRMSGLIDDVLDFARGRLGGGIGVGFAEEPDLGVAIAAVVAELHDAHPQRRLVSRIEIDRAVWCDRGRVQQLVSNLVGNALTHGAVDGSVELAAHVVDDQLLLTVWNDGEPIPPDSLDQVFSPFWRRSTSAQREGLGLGLYICAQIVKVHHGGLSVTSTRDRGTTFNARLPLRPLS